MYLAYLAGPITGLSFGESVDWREKFSLLVAPKVQGLSPMRCKDYLKDEAKIAHSYPTPLSCPKAIISRDFNDCKRCDILVANFLGSDKVSIGTTMEIAWAYSFRIPIILIMEKDLNPHEHPMIREAAGFYAETVKDAANMTKAILLP